MADEKLVRIVILPEFIEEGGKKVPITAIPVPLIDMFLGKTVELNPDAEISERYAEALMKTSSRFKIVDAKTKIKKDDYIVRKDYRRQELGNRFEQLDPDEKDLTIAYMDEMIANRNKPKPEAKDDGKADTGTKNKQDS